MPLVSSSQFFQYIPAAPKITSLSLTTGDIGDTVTLYGTDLDYIEDLILCGEKVNLNLISESEGNFIVPNNLTTGKLVASSTDIAMSENELNFLPIFKIDNFDPKQGPLGTLVTVSGKVLTSITTGYLLAEPITNDINYYFLSSNQTISLPTYSDTGNSDIVLIQNFNLNKEKNKFNIINYSQPTIASGRVLDLKFKEDLSQKYYEQHIFNFPLINSNNIKSHTGVISTGNLYVDVNLQSNFSDTGYAVFYSMNYTGTGNSNNLNYNTPFSYIDMKTISGFAINLCDTFNNDIKYYYLAVKYGTGVYDSGNYVCSGINLATGITDHNITFDNDKLYPPFILTSLEGLTNSGSALSQRRASIGLTYIDSNLYELNNNNFYLNLPSGSLNLSGTGMMKINYLNFDNINTNLNTFVLEGSGSYYEKIYLFTGDENSFKERVQVNNLQIINKNTLQFNIPDTDYYINGELILVNSIGLEKISLDSFREAPLATGLKYSNRYKGDYIIISGLSFKKPILIDGTGYNGVTVRFRYLEDLYKQKNNDFSMNCTLLDVNTLTGILPLDNLSSGRYMVQILDEKGNIYE